jgi:predicted Fe-Mo cluster-binding NifX family protein
MESLGAKHETLKIAVPLYGEVVSPRFGFADKILLVEFRAGREVNRRKVQLGPQDLPSRLNQLSDLTVDVLICGGFNRHYLPLAQSLGIQVLWGRGGSVTHAIKTVLQDEGKRLTLGKV